MSTKRKKKPAKRVGYVELTVRYAVDLDDKEMVQQAQDCIYEDVSNMVKYEEIAAWIKVHKADPKLRESDIPDFLLEDADERRLREEDEQARRADEQALVSWRRNKKRGAQSGDAP